MSVDFRPFAPDPNKEPKENFSDFLVWLSHSHIRLHEYQIGHAKYLRSIHEMLWNAGLRPGVPQPQAAAPQVSPDVSIGRVVDFARSAEPFLKMVGALFGR